MCRFFRRHFVNKIPKIPFPKICQGDRIWKEFLQTQVPIFWIVGPALSGKTTLAHFLSETSNYRILHQKHVTSTLAVKSGKITINDYVDQLKNEIKNTYKFCPGYIIDDFPSTWKECRRFEHEICKPTVIIYIELSFDATLARTLAQRPAVDLNAVRIQYVKYSKFIEKVARKYEKLNKVLKVFSQYPIQETNAKALEILETEFSYKFKTIAKPITPSY